MSLVKNLELFFPNWYLWFNHWLHYYSLECGGGGTVTHHAKWLSEGLEGDKEKRTFEGERDWLCESYNLHKKQ